MAYSTAAPSAEDVAALTAGKYMMTGPNKLVTGNPSVLKWVAGLSGGTGDTDATASGFETTRLYDGYSDRLSKPNATGDHTLAIFFPTAISFDTVAIINSTGIGVLDDVEVEIADDGTFATNLLGWGSIFPGLNGNGRGMAAYTGSAAVVSNVQYIRLKIPSTSGTINIGELFIGSRTQLLHNPKRPWDPNAKVGEMEVFTSQSGVNTKYIKRSGQHVVNAKLQPTESARQIALLEWESTTRGKPFLWTNEIFTSDFWWMDRVGDLEWSTPFVGPSEQETMLRFREQGPHYLDKIT